MQDQYKPSASGRALAEPVHLVQFLGKLDNATQSGDSWKALCPAHDDHSPSLSIKLGTDNQILIICRVGCKAEDVMKAVGLTMADLFEPKTKPAKTPLGPIVAVYDYRDEHGTLLYQNLRYAVPEKTFLVRRPDGPNKWIWKLGDVRRVPYRLPELFAADPSKIVFWVEGEKDANALIALGMVATTNAGGAKSWRPEYAQFLVGRSVCVIPDNDKPGDIYAEQVAASCALLGILVKVVRLSNLPKKGDASDFLANGGTAAELIRLWELETACEPLPPPDPAVFPAKLFGLSDDDNALRFAYAFGDRFRHCDGLGGWLIHDGTRWRENAHKAAVEHAKAVVRSIPREVALEPDTQKHPAILRHAAASLSATRIHALLSLAESVPGVTAEAEEFDAKPWLLPLLNGTYDLETHTLRPSDPNDLLTKRLDVMYDASARAPRFLAMLDTTLPPALGSVEPRSDKARLWQEWAGWCLTGDTSIKRFMILVGERDTGKTTVSQTLFRLLGDFSIPLEETVISAQAKSGTAGGAAEHIIRQKGARVMLVSETSKDMRVNEAFVKAATAGGSMLVGRLPHAPRSVTFFPTGKIIIETNYMPVFSLDDAFRARTFVLVFEHQVPKEKQDPRLLATLMFEEKAGMLNWAIEGLRRVQAQGLRFNVPESVTIDGLAQMAKSDPIQTFIEDNAIPMPNAATPASEVYDRYVVWCKRLIIKPVSRALFYKTLKSFPDYSIEAGTDNVRFIHGLILQKSSYESNGMSQQPTPYATKFDQMTGGPH